MPVPAGGSSVPAWAPQRAGVAKYIPHRTLVLNQDSGTEGEDVYRLDWDATTRPTAAIVDSLIADGAGWVSARVAPLHPSSQAAAATVVSLYAAAAVERGWPFDDSSLERARDLEKVLNDMLAGLIAANDLANAGDGDPETIDAVQPAWSFPLPDLRYDSAVYF